MASAPLVTHIYTADPSAHVFNGKLYIYPSHDRETDIAFNDNGDQYDMTDYHVLSLDTIDSVGSSIGAGKAATHPNGTSTGIDSSDGMDAKMDISRARATDHGIALAAADVPWASKQLWAPDCARGPDGRYYLYFPARDAEGIFRIGVAVGMRPEGPFLAERTPLAGSYSIDPAVFVDDDDDDDGSGDVGDEEGDGDGAAYLYFGGIWGGQLQCWTGGVGGGFDASRAGPQEPSGEGVLALLPRCGRLSRDMLSFDGEVRELEILDEQGRRLLADDHERRFFEAAWMHKYQGKYYFSYSTGDTHYLVYAIGDNPFGPFTYTGRILEPVLGWTTHHSIVEFEGKWYLFYHDCELSNGVDHLRSVKMREIFYDGDGRIHLEPKP